MTHPLDFDAISLRHYVRTPVFGIVVLTGLAFLTLLGPPSHAQRVGGFAVSPAGRSSGSGANPSRGLGPRSHRLRHRQGALGYGPYFYPDYETDQGDVAEATQHFVTQAPPSAAAPPAKAADSVVMELRGDHWVRLTSMGPMELDGGTAGAFPSVQMSA